MEEYQLEYLIKFIVDGKNLETVRDIKSLGSSITSMELCMIIEDYLQSINISDKNIKKISYNFNRDDVITLIANISSNKKLSKESLKSLKEDLFSRIEDIFLNNKIHTFADKSRKTHEVYLKVEYK